MADSFMTMPPRVDPSHLSDVMLPRSPVDTALAALIGEPSDTSDALYPAPVWSPLAPAGPLTGTAAYRRIVGGLLAFDCTLNGASLTAGQTLFSVPFSPSQAYMFQCTVLATLLGTYSNGYLVLQTNSSVVSSVGSLNAVTLFINQLIPL